MQEKPNKHTHIKVHMHERGNTTNYQHSQKKHYLIKKN